MKKFDFNRFRKYIPWLAMLMMVLAVTAAPLGIRADFGDYAGNDDYGGDWSGGSSHHSSSDGDGIGAIIWWLFRVVYDLFGAPGVIILILIFVIGYIVMKHKKKQQHGQAEPQRPPVNIQVQKTDRSGLSPMYNYLGYDQNFDEAAFKEKISNLYVQCQNAWQDKNMESLRPYLTDTMYAQFDRQLDVYRQKNQTNHIERIAVLSVELAGWKQTGGKDVIIAEVKTRIVDYVTDDNTGTVIRGSENQEKFMTYEWTLVRTSGQTTGTSSGTTTQVCPHCGAQINVNHTAVCEYCGSVLTTDTFDWVISNIKGLSQQTR